MTKTMQQNSSTIFCRINAELSEIKRTSLENENLLLSLFESLDSLNDELARLDRIVGKKLMKK